MNKPAEFNPQVKLETVPVWINGKALAPAGRHGEVFNPATGRVTKKVVFSDAALVDAAVQAAAAAFPAWRDTPVLRRARVMQKFLQLLQAQQKELAKIITEEHGKTLDDAMGSVHRGIEVVEFACGNTFILKPSEKVPSASVRMAELFKQAGLPDGVLNVIHGDKAAVDALLSHEGIKAVSFVGSTPVAKYIYETAAKAGKRVQALGGAKNHAVVLPDADLEFAADALIGAAYGSAGERCMAISAVVAVGAAGDPLVKLLEKKAKQIKLGVDMGPLVTRQHRDKVASYIDIGLKEGARLVVDARQQQTPQEGFYLGTSLFDQVTPGMEIYRNEIFGPILIVLRAGTIDEAISIINRNPYANGTAIFTESGGAARRFQNEVQVGMVGINVPIPVPVAFYSFGGWKSSLFGDLHVHGTEAVRFYTRTKVVTTRWPHQDTPAPGFDMPTLG